jgi:hypothetical protein
VADRDQWVILSEQVRNRENKIPEMQVKSDHQDHVKHVRNFIECVKTRNFQTACTIENGSLCAKYAHLGNIAARTNTTLIYDDKVGKFTGMPDADKFIKPAYRAPWKFPEL